MSLPPYAATTLEPLSPERAKTCRQVAALAGFRHACPRCAEEALPGSVCGFFTEAGLRAHLLDVHGMVGTEP